MVDPQQFTSSI